MLVSGFDLAQLAENASQRGRQLLNDLQTYLERDYEQLNRDLVELDNRAGVDRNSQQGSIVLNLADPLPLLAKDAARSEELVRLETAISGQARLDDRQKLTSCELHGLFGPDFSVKTERGFLGLGQERLIVQRGGTVAMFFEDGTIECRRP